MALDMQLTADDIRVGLRRNEVKAAITTILGDMVRRANLIHFVGVYDRSGDCWIKDPYNQEWSIKKEDEQEPFYAALGRAAAPIMEHYHELLINGPARSGPLAEEIGAPDFILLRNGIKGGSTARHIAVAPMENTYEFFLVALQHKLDKPWAYNLFQTEFEDYRKTIVRALTGR